MRGWWGSCWTCLSAWELSVLGGICRTWLTVCGQACSGGLEWFDRLTTNGEEGLTTNGGGVLVGAALLLDSGSSPEWRIMDGHGGTRLSAFDSLDQ